MARRIADNTQTKAWCGTWNNYPEDGIDIIRNLPNLTYMVVGREVGESGTPHLQMYLQFTNRKKLITMRNSVNNQVHWEPARGTAMANRTYCTKDGAYEEWGEMNEVMHIATVETVTLVHVEDINFRNAFDRMLFQERDIEIVDLTKE